MGDIKENHWGLVWFGFFFITRQTILLAGKRCFYVSFICLRPLGEWVQSLIPEDVCLYCDMLSRKCDGMACPCSKRLSLHAPRLRNFTYVFDLGDKGIVSGAWLKICLGNCLNSMFAFKILTKYFLLYLHAPVIRAVKEVLRSLINLTCEQGGNSKG